MNNELKHLLDTVPMRTGSTLPFWRRAILIAMRVRVNYGDAAIQLTSGEKPIILVASHASMLDGPLLAMASPRPLFFAVNKRHAQHHFAISRLLRWMERHGLGTVVPLDSSSIFGIRRLRRALLDGHSICIFPEGRISAGQPLPEQPGSAWLAEATGATVVRVRIEGAERSRWLAPGGDQMWPRIRLTF